MKKRFLLIAAFVLCVCLYGCGEANQQTNTTVSTPRVTATNTPTPTNTPYPTLPPGYMSIPSDAEGNLDALELNNNDLDSNSNKIVFVDGVVQDAFTYEGSTLWFYVKTKNGNIVKCSPLVALGVISDGDKVRVYGSYYHDHIIIMTNAADTLLFYSILFQYDDRITYKDLARQPNKYIDKKIAIEGEIIQVLQEKKDDKVIYNLRVNMTETDYGYTDTVMVYYEANADDDKLLTGDIISIMGVGNGEITYTSVLGESITIPYITAENLTINKED